MYPRITNPSKHGQKQTGISYGISKGTIITPLIRSRPWCYINLFTYLLNEWKWNSVLRVVTMSRSTTQNDTTSWHIVYRARIVDFLWITILWQSPRRYRDIVTIATSADDWQQTRDIGKACARPSQPAQNTRDNGVCVKRWCQPCSHCGAEEPFTRDRDWNDAVTN